MKAIGVRQFLDHDAGKLSLDEAIAAVKTETRRYAKRQVTWFRHQAADWPTGVSAVRERSPLDRCRTFAVDRGCREDYFPLSIGSIGDMATQTLIVLGERTATMA